MKKTSTNAITSLPPAPRDERRARMIEYTVMMSIRVLCIVACLVMAALHIAFVWILIPAMGAIFLPYFAVVTANAVQQKGGDAVERPGAIVRRGNDDEDGR